MPSPAERDPSPAGEGYPIEDTRPPPQDEGVMSQTLREIDRFRTAEDP
jgi:hypothetical protein